MLLTARALPVEADGVWSVGAAGLLSCVDLVACVGRAAGGRGVGVGLV